MNSKIAKHLAIPPVLRIAFFSVLFFFHFLNSRAQWFLKVDSLSINLDSSYCYGASWIDVDKDNDLDLFHSIAGAGNVSNQLHLNQGNGTFLQAGGLNITSDGGKSLGNGWADINNDGEVDLFVNNTSPDSNFLYINNGSGSSFTKILTGNIATDIAPNEGNSSWGDFDNDGLVDLYVVTWNNASNLFYRNTGNATFSKIITGAIATDPGWNSCAVWGDDDNDGYADLYVARYVDAGGINPASNKLYQNNGNGTFTSIGTGNPVTDLGKSRSANWVDVDNDRDLDLFVANEGPDHLYQNNGNGSFTSVLAGLIVTENVRGDASNWGDFDNDGDQDLFVVGQISGHHRFFENMGNGTFNSINPDNITNLGIWMVGVGFVDYNIDGWLDVHALNYGDTQKDYVWKNLGSGCRNFAQFRLEGDSSNWSAIGTRVSVKATISGNQVWQMQEVSAQTAKGVQNPQFLHFGLLDAAIMDSVIVVWPAGGSCIFTNVSSKNFYHIKESCQISSVKSWSFNPLGNDTVICGGDSIVLSAGNTGGVSWSWQNGSSDSTFHVTAPGTYWITLDTIGLCDGADTITVKMFWPESVHLGNDTAICQGDSIILIAADASGTGPWLWSDNTTDSILVVFSGGSWSVTTGPMACQATDTIVINVNQPIPFSIGADTVICEGDTISLVVPAGFTNPFWMDSVSNASLSIAQPGVYWLFATDSNGCLSKDSIGISNCLGWNEADSDSWQIFPNPAFHELQIISAPGLPGEEYIASWKDIHGRHWNEFSFRGTVVANTSEFPAGVYFLLLKQVSTGEIFRKKVLISH